MNKVGMRIFAPCHKLFQPESNDKTSVTMRTIKEELRSVKEKLVGVEYTVFNL